MKHNSIKTLLVPPAGYSIIDPESNTPITWSLYETTIPSGALNIFASMVFDSTKTNIIIDSKSFREVGYHTVSLKLTDSLGATCTYPVYSVLV
jgi:hypothetical protein